EALAPRADLAHLVGDEALGALRRDLGELRALQLAVEPLVAGEAAQVEERGAGGVVVGGERHAALHVAHAVADLELQVPERVEELLAGGLGEGVRLASIVNDEEVEVAEGREL